jgi:hypothetical protein
LGEGTPYQQGGEREGKLSKLISGGEVIETGGVKSGDELLFVVIFGSAQFVEVGI